jgi:Transglycosylase SLT domain
LMRFCFRMGWLGGWLALELYAGSLSDPSPRRITTVVRMDRHSGKLVRTMTASAAASSIKALEPHEADPAIAAAVGRIAAEQTLPAELIHSVIKVESNYNPFAISPKGALGLMQLIPATARRFGVADVFDPVDNIQGGARYLKYLLDLYHGDYPLALAAYNAGEEAVARYGGVPPFPETQNYVVQVRKQIEMTAKAGRGDAKTTTTELAPAPEEPAGPRHLREIVEPDGSVRYVSR